MITDVEGAALEGCSVTIELKDMDLKELKALRKNVDKAIDQFEARRKQRALAAANAAAEEMGYSLADLMAKTTEKSGKSAKPPKYVNPTDPSQTWTGRGRQPNWVKAALSDGQSLDDLLIVK